MGAQVPTSAQSLVANRARSARTSDPGQRVTLVVSLPATLPFDMEAIIPRRAGHRWPVAHSEALDATSCSAACKKERACAASECLQIADAGRHEARCSGTSILSVLWRMVATMVAPARSNGESAPHSLDISPSAILLGLTIDV